MRKSWKLSRRHVLRGTGIAMALPLLETMCHGAGGSSSYGRRRRRRGSLFRLINTNYLLQVAVDPEHVHNSNNFDVPEQQRQQQN